MSGNVDNRVLQSGTVTPRHVAIWTTDGVVEDGGTSAESKLTSLGITAAGDTSFAINDATVIGPYSAFSLGINPTNGALISVDSFNGAPLLGLHFRINGNLSNLFINPDGTASVPAGGPFLPLIGGALSGALSLFGNATSALHAVPLQQLTAATIGVFLPLTGGSISPGPLNIVNGNTLTLRTSPTQAQINYNAPNMVLEASVFAGTITGNVLTITGGSLQGTINAGDSVYWNGGGASGKVVSGSGLTWTLDASYPAPITTGASFTGSILDNLLTTTGTVTGTLGTNQILLWSGGSDTIVGQGDAPNTWNLAHHNGSVPSQAMTTTSKMSSNNKESIPPLDARINLQGTIPVGGITQSPWGGLRLGSTLDNLALPGRPLSFLDINSISTGSNYAGHRYGITIGLQVNTPITADNSGLLQSFYFTTRGRATQGGTPGRGNGRGQIWGGDITTTLSGAATNYQLLSGLEFDVAAVAGSSVEGIQALTIVHQAGHAVQGTYSDIAFGIGDQGNVTAGWRVGLSVGGPNSQWPIDPNGLLWRSNYAPSVPWTTGPGAQAAGGFDVQQVDFTGTSNVGGGFAFRADGAQIIPALGNPGGTFEAGAGEFSGTSTGAKIDTTFSQMSGTPAVVAGGSLWGVGDTLNDQYGNLLLVATVAGDAIATVTVLRRGWQKTPPSNPVAFAIATAGSTSSPYRLGTGATFNLTWTLNNTLSLQPSGGTVQVGSGCIAANGSVATVLGSVGPVGSHTTVQEWFAIKNASGVTRYIAAF